MTSLKILKFFVSPYPFLPTNVLNSMSSGLKADSSINYHMAYENEIENLSKLVGGHFGNMNF